MREKSFAALILTHGRPDRVYTYQTLRKQGYTGRIVVVIDNEDRTADEYHRRYGAEVVVFDKAAAARTFDEADNFGDRRAIIYARNASFDICRELGIDYFIQLDDDYTEFRYRRDSNNEWVGLGPVHVIRSLDSVFDAMVEYVRTAPIASIAMAQGGDFIGGVEGKGPGPKRKCMNSFVCSTARPFKFIGRINEDVNTYTYRASQGLVFLTTTQVSLQQKQTQSNRGGMTDLYLASGTYVKSFYTVMLQPSSVVAGVLKDRTNARIHHRVNWRATVPLILSEEYKK